MNRWQRARFALLVAAGSVGAVLAVLAVLLLAGRWLALPHTGDWRKDWTAATENQRIPLVRRMVTRGELIGHPAEECFEVFGETWLPWGTDESVLMLFHASVHDTGKLLFRGLGVDGQFFPADLTPARALGAEGTSEKLPDWAAAWKNATPEERVQIAKTMARRLEGHSLSECIELSGGLGEALWSLGTEEDILGSAKDFDLVVQFNEQGQVSSAQLKCHLVKPGPLRRLLGLD